jgi:hypothetical protein
MLNKGRYIVDATHLSMTFCGGMQAHPSKKWPLMRALHPSQAQENGAVPRTSARPLQRNGEAVGR